MPIVKLNRPKAVGIHIFAGGFTVGIKQAGFDVICHLEDGKYGVASAKLNWPRMPIYQKASNWPLEQLSQEGISLVYCNPPCAPFSTAGPSTTKGPDAWKTDPRLLCWQQCLHAFTVIQPKVFVMESVTQAYSKGKPLIDEFTKQGLLLGYSVIHLLEDVQWLGIPQSRKRFFLVFHKPWLPLEFRYAFDEPPSVREVLSAISDIGEVDAGHLKNPIHAKCVKLTPQGGKLRTTFDELNKEPEISDRGTIKGRPGFLYARLHETKTMGAFIGDVFIHPTKHRFLGINEMKALCGYPQDFKLEGGTRQHPSLLARAVLPPIGRWLGKTVRAVLRQPKRSWVLPTVTLTDLRRPLARYSDLTSQYVDCDRQQTDLYKLFCDVKSCGKCRSICHHHHVLSSLNGRYLSRILFIGEAPGKEIIGKIGVPMYGDASGENFEQLLSSVGLARRDVMITNSILCSPLNSFQAMRSPTEQEVQNCSTNLRELIETLDPKIVVTMGLAALSAIKLIANHSISLKNNVGKIVDWNGRKLLPVYHPSPRVLGSIRSMKEMKRDFKPLREFNTKIIYKKPAIVKTDNTTCLDIGSSVASSKPTLLLTGSTAMQVGSRKTQMGILTSMACWKTAFEEMGYDVDWRIVIPGEDISRYDVVACSLNKPNVRSASYVDGVVWSLAQRRDALIMVDDWQVSGVVSDFKSASATEERFFRLRVDENGKATKYSTDNRKTREVILRKAVALGNSTWPHVVVPPIIGDGNVGLLNLPGYVIPIDPTQFARRYEAVVAKKKLRWVQASLLEKPAPRTSWPLVSYGWRNASKGQGGYGKNAQERIKEEDLMKVYCESWGILSPAHPHAGSGWWRVRYLMSADACCVLSADPKEAACLGEPYLTAAGDEGIKLVESLTSGKLRRLAIDQRERFKEITWSKERVKDALADAVRQAKSMTMPSKRKPAVRRNPTAKKKLAKVAGKAETSGEFIRRMWMTGKYATPDGVERLVELVYENWSNFPVSANRECRTKASDVRWNVQKLINDGVEGVPPFPTTTRRKP